MSCVIFLACFLVFGLFRNIATGNKKNKKKTFLVFIKNIWIGAMAISKVVGTSSTLEDLDLSKNILTNEGVVAIVTQWSNNKKKSKLKTIDLSETGLFSVFCFLFLVFSLLFFVLFGESVFNFGLFVCVHFKCLKKQKLKLKRKVYYWLN